MGFTNIHHATQLLNHAGGEQFFPAIMPDHQRFINLNGHNFTQEELDAFTDILHHPRKDVWLRRKNDIDKFLVAGRADDPIDRPSVRTSTGLKKDHRPAVRRIDEPEDTSPKPALAFVLIIRGRSAALCSKVRLSYSLKAAAAVMFEEAVNGYSTVFSAALLKTDVRRLDQPDAQFKKVDTIAQLYEAVEGRDRDAIALLCGEASLF